MSGASVQAAVLAALKSDVGVQEIFGTPARIFDDETDAPMFPYAQLERHEVNDKGASGVAGAEHRLTIAVLSRSDGLAAAKEALGALKRVVEGEPFAVMDGHVVMQQVIYADTMRRADRRAFRGVLRIRMIVEEVT